MYVIICSHSSLAVLELCTFSMQFMMCIFKFLLLLFDLFGICLKISISNTNQISDYCAVHIIVITIIIGESLACISSNKTCWHACEYHNVNQICVFLLATGLYIYAFYIVNLLVFLGSPYVSLHCVNTSEWNDKFLMLHYTLVCLRPNNK